MNDNAFKERSVKYYEEWTLLQDGEVEYPTFQDFCLEQECQREARLEADRVEHMREFDP